MIRAFTLGALLCVFTAINPSISLSQSFEEDSLTNAFFSTADHHKKVLILAELKNELSNSNPVKALEISYQALDLAKDIGELDVMIAYNLIGGAYIGTAQFDSATFYLQLAHDLAKKNQDTVYMSKAMNNLGIVYMNIGDYDKGLECFSESGRLEFISKNYSGALVSFLNLGNVQVQLGQYIEANLNLKKALEIAIETKDRVNEGTVYLSMGYMKAEMRDIEKAEELFFKAIYIQEELSDFDGVAKSYINLAVVSRIQKNYRLALKFDLKSLEYAEKLSSNSAKKHAYEGIAQNHELLGDYKNALLNYRLYMDWRDTIQIKENRAVIIEMQEKYNSTQTGKENEILLQQNKIKDLANKESNSKLNQSRIVIVSSIIGLLLLVGLAVVLYNRNIIKNKANIQLQIANDIIQEKNNDITASILYASKIQEALLPTKEDTLLFRDSFFLLKPKDIVSGDFLWHARLEDKVVFTAVDCTGHGVPGAFMSMIGNTFLHQIVNEKKVVCASDILDQLREKVIGALSKQGGDEARKDGMDMSICVLDKSTLELEFAGANNPLYIINDGKLREIKGDKQPVGYMPERNEPFTNHIIQLAKDDLIYIFSDGYADQFGGPKEKKFKYRQLKELLYKHHKKQMADQKKILTDTFEAWKGNLEQIDDMCFIGVRV